MWGVVLREVQESRFFLLLEVDSLALLVLFGRTIGRNVGNLARSGFSSSSGLQDHTKRCIFHNESKAFEKQECLGDIKVQHANVCVEAQVGRARVDSLQHTP